MSFSNQSLSVQNESNTDTTVTSVVDESSSPRDLSIQYLCGYCNGFYEHEAQFEKHIQLCMIINDSHGLINKNQSLKKRKLTETERQPLSSDISVENEYEITSEIINENEILITLHSNKNKKPSICTSSDVSILRTFSKIDSTQSVDAEKESSVSEPHKLVKKLDNKQEKINKVRNCINDISENTDTSKLPKLYEVIPKIFKKKQEPQDVYDFFDEEEEKIKEKELKEREQAIELKKRTCCYCKEVFPDPIDVLRHKRELHQFPKTFLSKEELAPYMEYENISECPICFKTMQRIECKSIYLKHLLTHSKDYNNECKICGKTFRRMDHCQTHEKKHIVKLD
ncbi:zinc finger protein 200-like [Sitophilus oryzae]|uniref:Zinc finger protein 200-like n=1 Tax=Sitophilus oryzae TaxID=7048 RepID=A0A6J2YSG1_SITOR|nr:zinc finger protein 200-like [Sitophilus oryzae]